VVTREALEDPENCLWITPRSSGFGISGPMISTPEHIPGESVCLSRNRMRSRSKFHGRRLPEERYRPCYALSVQFREKVKTTIGVVNIRRKIGTNLRLRSNLQGCRLCRVSISSIYLQVAWSQCLTHNCLYVSIGRQMSSKTTHKKEAVSSPESESR
jgi:hypothetical protein